MFMSIISCYPGSSQVPPLTLVIAYPACMGDNNVGEFCTSACILYYTYSIFLLQMKSPNTNYKIILLRVHESRIRSVAVEWSLHFSRSSDDVVHYPII